MHGRPWGGGAIGGKQKMKLGKFQSQKYVRKLSKMQPECNMAKILITSKILTTVHANPFISKRLKILLLIQTRRLEKYLHES